MKKSLEKRILDILEWPLIEEKLRDLCASEPGRNLVFRLRPIPEHKIKSQMAKISALKNLILRGDSPPPAAIDDISLYAARAGKGGILELEELFKIRRFVHLSEKIKSFLFEVYDQFPPLEDEYSKIESLAELNSILSSSITDEGNINEGKYHILKKIRNEIHSTRQSLEKKISSIIHSPENEKIIQEKTYTTINSRYVLLVKSNQRGKIKGNLHDISASGATVYIEPAELTELNNNLVMLEKELSLEIQKILAELSFAVSQNHYVLLSNLRTLTYFDFITAAAKFSIKTKSNEPKIISNAILRLYSARHPLLQIMQPESTVANDVSLGMDFNCLIISGANTGGKTVMLKTIGLCALFAMYGLHIPAGPDSEIGIFDNIMADIGDDQNLSQSLSTFSGQLSIINDILQKADHRTLVIIDEIIVGTNPRQGAALAQAILENMIERDCKIVVSTHYTELKELAVNDSRFQNASVTFNLDTLRPTYELKIGIPGISYALEIARNFGIKDSVLNRARQLIDSKETSIEALIEKVQRYEEEILKEKEKVKNLSEELLLERGKIEKKQQELQRLIFETKKGKGIDFLDELSQYREAIARHLENLQNLDRNAANNLSQEILKIREKISQDLAEETRERYSDELEPLDPQRACKGMAVFIATIEKEGVLDDLDSSGKTAQVILGGTIKARFNLKDLFILPKSTPADKKGAIKIKQSMPEIDPIPCTIQTSYNTIDLRGMRVEEALISLDRELDRMDRNNIGTVIIIHGHGTGALKQAIRDALKMNIYVRDFRPGEYGEGGDGVTVARLR